ncbi:hypothetical protein AWC38_SpisGene22506 [Stylophora pistillata]|uniref:Integrase catalytic domain-containing protein n=1 Tax=Stylophora pistillata TaxID=50429 RepID=A0A2B4RAK4_STYPI|nr:hypothetical protein AWC38_SpisGene22506 [Stylophora pistillata]
MFGQGKRVDPLSTEERGPNRQRLSPSLPIQIKTSLGPQREVLIAQKDKEIEEKEQSIRDDKEISGDENEDATIREQARERITENQERIDALENERERLKERLSLRVRLINIFKKYGFKVSAVVLAVGTTIGVTVSTLKIGLSLVLYPTALCVFRRIFEGISQLPDSSDFTVVFKEPLVNGSEHIRLVSCSLYNSWQNLGHSGEISLLDAQDNSSERNYSLKSLGKVLEDGLKNEGVKARQKVAALNVTNVELELLSDPDILVMFVKGIRKGISMISNRYARANNKYMGEKFDREKPSKYPTYLDANNLYGCAMCMPLPVRCFKWMRQAEIKKWRNIPCILENMEGKLSRVYYSPKGFWKGLDAVKKLVKEDGVPEDVARLWLMKQATWQIYLPAPKHIPRAIIHVESPNTVHRADLIFLLHNRLPRGRKVDPGREFMDETTKEKAKHDVRIRRGNVNAHRDQGIVEGFNLTLSERLFTFQYGQEINFEDKNRSTEWVKRLPEVVSALNSEETRLTGKKLIDAIKEKAVDANSPTSYSRPVGFKEKRLESSKNVRYLYAACELEGSQRRATVPIWSLKDFNIEKVFVNEREPVLCYLKDRPKRGFVREELQIVPSKAELPPEGFR